MSLAIAMVAGEAFPAALRILPILLLGLVSYGVSLALAVRAMRVLGAAREAALFAVAPFFGAVLSVPILGERLGRTEILATLILATGLVVLLREHHEHEHTHSALEHDHAHTHDEHHQHRHSPDDPPGESHAHAHRHERLTHSHGHRPDAHHRHRH
jgi:hypothetical protein